MRSIWLNYEVSLLVFDKDFVTDLRALQQGYLNESDAVILVSWDKRPMGTRLVESTMRLLTPLL